MKRNMFIMLMLFILSSIVVNAEFSTDVNVFVSDIDGGQTRVRKVMTVLVSARYDDELKVTTEGDIPAVIVYSVEPLSMHPEIDYISVSCTKIDVSYDFLTLTSFTNTTLVHQVNYTTANTPLSFELVIDSYGKNDQMQCIFDQIYNSTVANITLDYFYQAESLTPSYNTKFIGAFEDWKTYISQDTNIRTMESLKIQIADWTTIIIRGVFEIWLIMFFFVKIAMLYVAFGLLVLGIVAPVIVLVKLREKIKQWVSKSNKVEG